MRCFGVVVWRMGRRGVHERIEEVRLLAEEGRLVDAVLLVVEEGEVED